METLIVDVADFVCTVTINRPKKYNALNKTCLQELKTVFEDIKNRDDIRAVIITGAGPKAFVAGADIAELAELDESAAQSNSSYGQEVFALIENCGKVVIAAVNGFALGGGCELSLAAHFRIASDQAKFSLPEVTLGLIPGYGGTQRLARTIGLGPAKQMIATGDMIHAQQALQWSLVNEVVPQDTLIKRCHEIAKLICERAPLAVTRALQAVDIGFKEGLEKGYASERQLFGECFNTEDMKLGTQAFLSGKKEKVEFQGT